MPLANPRIWCLAAILLTGCASKEAEVRDFSNIDVTMPNGKTLHVEVMQRSIDMSRGLMFRDSLPSDHGMLFLYAAPGSYQYWTFQVKFPIDIVWLDQNHRVVEVAASVPPCTSASAQQCPFYGGHEKSQYVIEMGAGMAEKYGIDPGKMVVF